MLVVFLYICFVDMGNQPGSGRTNVINQKANRQWQSLEKLKNDVKKANS